MITPVRSATRRPARLPSRAPVPRSNSAGPRCSGEGADGAILAGGALLPQCLEAADRMTAEEGVELTVVNARFIKPLDTDTILPIVERSPFVVTVEESALAGGFGSARPRGVRRRRRVDRRHQAARRARPLRRAWRTGRTARRPLARCRGHRAGLPRADRRRGPSRHRVAGRRTKSPRRPLSDRLAQPTSPFSDKLAEWRLPLR